MRNYTFNSMINEYSKYNYRVIVANFACKKLWDAPAVTVNSSRAYTGVWIIVFAEFIHFYVLMPNFVFNIEMFFM
jgi:hypothetical protein